jgi:hypothetical protein
MPAAAAPATETAPDIERQIAGLDSLAMISLSEIYESYVARKFEDAISKLDGFTRLSEGRPGLEVLIAGPEIDGRRGAAHNQRDPYRGGQAVSTKQWTKRWRNRMREDPDWRERERERHRADYRRALSDPERAAKIKSRQARRALKRRAEMSSWRSKRRQDPRGGNKNGKGIARVIGARCRRPTARQRFAANPHAVRSGRSSATKKTEWR